MSILSLLLATVLTNALDVAQIVDRFRVTDDTFELFGRISFIHRPSMHASSSRLAIEDGTGITGLFCNDQNILHEIQAGDIVKASGNFRDNVVPQPFVLSLTRVSRGAPPNDLPLNLDKMLAGELNWRSVILQGTLKDVTLSDLSHDWALLRVHYQGYSLLGAVVADQRTYRSLRNSIGSTLTARAVCAPWDGSLRNRIGHVFWIESFQAISIHTSPGDPFDVPSISAITSLHPETMLCLGRHRAQGRVVAVWQNQYALLQDDNEQIASCDFLDTPMPDFNSTIEVAGFPSSDLYHINLSHATWRHVSAPVRPIPEAIPIRLPFGGQQFANNHGHRLRTQGTVKSRPDEFSRFYLDAGSQILLIDISSLPSLIDKFAVGSVIAVTGTCVMNINHSTYNDTIPRIADGSIVVNRAEDIQLIARPPWLTPRIIAFSALLLITLIVVGFLWNHSINRIATKRRLAERTRLAIELHDSLSQNLTGVACQVAAARNALSSDPAAVDPRLQTAERMLGSCRSELANCLFDLRSDAIDDRDLASAIRKSLGNILDGCSVFIRFNVDRRLLPDTTAHTILSIIRELAANAVRHGNADTVRIAGLTEEGRIVFSVTDNGTGFDPERAPGPGEGHFGLQGIRDRLERISGTMDVESSPDRGTRVRISVKLNRQT